MQRGLLLFNLLFNLEFETNKYYNDNNTYKYVIWIDFDAIFLNDNINIKYLINHVNNMYNYNYSYNNSENNNSLSLLVAGDWNHVINAGVLLFQKNNITKYLLKTWMNVMTICQYWTLYTESQDIEKTKLHNTSCYLNDQSALTMVLFDEHYGLTKEILLLNELHNNFDYSSYNIWDYYKNTILQIMNSFYPFIIEPEQNVNIDCTIYGEMVVIGEQCIDIAKKISSSSIFYNHIFWIEQNIFNSNIWQKFRIPTTQFLKPLILHFAGPTKGSNLLPVFLNYKKIMNNQSVSTNVKEYFSTKLEGYIENYVYGRAKKYKVKKLVQSKTTHDKYVLSLYERNITQPFLNCSGWKMQRTKGTGFWIGSFGQVFDEQKRIKI